jgi:DICT domain-containing protein
MSATLHDLVAAVEGRSKQLTVYAPESKAPLANELEEYFASQNVDITFRSDNGTEPRAELADETGEALVAVEIESLEALVSGSPGPLGVEQRPYAPLLAHLDETTFTSYDRRQMVHASREIEDRAWRERGGHLLAGFQHLSNFAAQAEVYRTLADAGIDIDVYGVADTEVPEGPFTVHAAGDTDLDIAGTWFVVFDGDGNDDQKSALLAEERDDGFYGFWTYDPTLVDAVIATLEGEAIDLDSVRRAVQ